MKTIRFHKIKARPTGVWPTKFMFNVEGFCYETMRQLRKAYPEGTRFIQLPATRKSKIFG